MENNEVIEPSEDISQEALDKVGEVISKIEMSKQQTALAQIAATSEDNKRQFEYAMSMADKQEKRWNKALLVGSFGAAVLSIVGIILIFTGDKATGIGLIASTFSAVLGYLAGIGSHK